MAEIIEHDGQQFLRVGDKAAPISGFDANGKPIIKVDAKEIRRPDGTQDVVVTVPCLSIRSEQRHPLLVLLGRVLTRLRALRQLRRFLPKTGDETNGKRDL